MQSASTVSQIFNILMRNAHVVFFFLKYVLLATLGWGVSGVIEGPVFVVIGLALFFLFDLAAWALWWILKPGKGVVTIWMLLAFYSVQVMAISTLLISVFSPQLLAGVAQFIVDVVF